MSARAWITWTTIGLSQYFRVNRVSISTNVIPLKHTRLHRELDIGQDPIPLSLSVDQACDCVFIPGRHLVLRRPEPNWASQRHAEGLASRRTKPQI
jgi:hypothetical protein